MKTKFVNILLSCFLIGLVIFTVILFINFDGLGGKVDSAGELVADTFLIILGISLFAVDAFISLICFIVSVFNLRKGKDPKNLYCIFLNCSFLSITIISVYKMFYL